MKFHQSSRFIKDFDWDKKIQICLNIKNHITYIGCDDLFVKKRKSRNVKNFFFKSQIEKYGIFKNCKNENDLLIYFKNL